MGGAHAWLCVRLYRHMHQGIAPCGVWDRCERNRCVGEAHTPAVGLATTFSMAVYHAVRCRLSIAAAAAWQRRHLISLLSHCVLHCVESRPQQRRGTKAGNTTNKQSRAAWSSSVSA
eukprot:jgi/Ulvmu1/1747/UM117_0024.1